MKNYNKKTSIFQELNKSGGDILKSKNFKSSRNYIQHGKMSVNRHSIFVAQTSLAISQKLGIKCNRRELIRGALLHDYFLYDWHTPVNLREHRWHGFYHPGIALRNAAKEYELSDREKDIIRKHMWPLTIVPPTCREAWIVTMADKYCSLLETFHIMKEQRYRKKSGRVIPAFKRVS
ncbi:MAG: HD domain-containing protein [Lachnospiraceae bacterium]|nr:HD domain-containing protein [Lachnospiraceae bacterium]